MNGHMKHEWTYEGSEPPKTKLTKEGHRYYPEGEPETELTTWLFEEGTFVPLAKLVGERSYSIACDHLGTPTVAYDEAGNRVWQRELDIYGRVRQEEGETNFVPFLFQGQYYDVETKLAYNRFRYYAPEWGMYISQDPIRLEAGLTNLYAYVHDTNGWIDPFGLIAEVYKLVAVKDGFYDVYEWGHSKPVGKVYLRAGETWKIGETTQFRIRKNKPPIQTRYSQTWLAKMGLKYETLQHSPNKSAKSSFMVYETNRIQKHEMRFGMKPPGNKCTH